MTCKSIIRGLHTLVSLLQAAAFIAVTFSYYVRLQNTTVQPIRQIIASRGNEALTKERISKFVTGKERELRHVQIAVRNSAYHHLYQR
jgi:hypothetical protein